MRPIEYENARAGHPARRIGSRRLRPAVPVGFWAHARRIACLEPPTAPLDMKKGGHRASWTTLAAVNEPENMPRAEKPTISMDA